MEKRNNSITTVLSKEEYYQLFFNYIEQFFEYKNKTLTGLTFNKKNQELLNIKTYNQELIYFLYYNNLATHHQDTIYDNVELFISKKHISFHNIRLITTTEVFMYKIMEFLHSKLGNYEIMIGYNNNTDYIDFRQIQIS